jgi:uncharacterized Zn-finger protein
MREEVAFTAVVAVQSRRRGVAAGSVHADAPDAAVSLRSFPCPVEGCSKTFRRRFALKDHITSHTGEKPFECPVEGCGRSFTTSGNLSRHSRIQHPWLSVPLDCLIGDCDCSFSSLAQLERHVAMVHFEASPHACTVRGCGRAFATVGNLRRHKRQQHFEGEERGGGDERGEFSLLSRDPEGAV